jgi:hypothetical protein
MPEVTKESRQIMAKSSFAVANANDEGADEVMSLLLC